MTGFLFEYGLFLAKTLTLVLAVAVVVVLMVTLARKDEDAGGLKVERLNDRYRDLAAGLRQALLGKAAWKKLAKKEAKARKQRDKAGPAESEQRTRVFVLDFKGDLRATAVASLREEVSAILAVADAGDEVVLRLENHGGAVHEHGLAASQLLRLRAAGLELTAIVDKVAASGGYMMACVASRIIAAPFAVVGSIGVIAQIPNFSRALSERGVEFEQVTAGRYKRTVTMFGRNTDADREKLQEELEEVHGLFKAMVTEHRPSLDIETIATGEHWYGSRALELGLVDLLGTSDDYLLAAARRADVFGLRYRTRRRFSEKMLAALQATVEQAGLWFEQRGRERRLP